MTPEDPPFDRFALPPIEGLTDLPAPPPIRERRAARPIPPIDHIEDDEADGDVEDEYLDDEAPVDDVGTTDAGETGDAADEPDADENDAYFSVGHDAPASRGPLSRRLAERVPDPVAEAEPIEAAAPMATLADALAAAEALSAMSAAPPDAEARATSEADERVFAAAAHGVRDDSDGDPAALDGEALDDDALDDDSVLPPFLRGDTSNAVGSEPVRDVGDLETYAPIFVTETQPATTVAAVPLDRPKVVGKPTVARTLAEIPVLLIVAALIAFLVKTFLAQAYYIPSGSMLPQLQIDDRVVVSKLAYKAHDPHRGDIVVFDDPRPGLDKATVAPRTGVQKWVRKVGEGVGVVQPSTDEFIKRVIGLPGERVSGHDGFVYINGHKLLEPYLPDGVETSDFPAQRVAKGKLWVMGDNRGGSADSRVFGQIRISTIVGRAMVKVWPFNHISFL